MGALRPLVDPCNNAPHAPVVGYYPAIIDRVDWDSVQAKRAAWSAHHHNDVAKTGRANLLAGLSRCPFCDRAMVLVVGAKPNWRYLLCRRAFNGVGCSDHWVRYPGIEDTLTIDIEDVIRSCPKPVLSSDVRSHRLKQIRIRLHTLRVRQSSIRTERTQLRQSSRPALAASGSVDDEIARLLDDRKRLRIDRPRWLDVTLSVKLDKLRSVAKATVVDRHELHSVLRSLVTKVVVDWERNQLVFHWKHGGESAVRVAMKPQRDVENPRRSDRSRFKPGERAPLLPEVKR
jgi:hypothetical protein